VEAYIISIRNDVSHPMSSKSFQRRVEEWLAACFPPTVRADRQERTHRFLEEALELAQANGCSREHARMLVDYVYSRPAGRPEHEVGGVMVTLAGLCSATRIDMKDEGDHELDRNWERINAIRQKQTSKPHGSPLPQ
jgi:hypothetical protein